MLNLQQLPPLGSLYRSARAAAAISPPCGLTVVSTPGRLLDPLSTPGCSMSLWSTRTIILTSWTSWTGTSCHFSILTATSELERGTGCGGRQPLNTQASSVSELMPTEIGISTGANLDHQATVVTIFLVDLNPSARWRIETWQLSLLLIETK